MVMYLELIPIRHFGRVSSLVHSSGILWMCSCRSDRVVYCTSVLLTVASGTRRTSVQPSPWCQQTLALYPKGVSILYSAVTKWKHIFNSCRHWLLRRSFGQHKNSFQFLDTICSMNLLLLMVFKMRLIDSSPSSSSSSVSNSWRIVWVQTQTTTLTTFGRSFWSPPWQRHAQSFSSSPSTGSSSTTACPFVALQD